MTDFDIDKEVERVIKGERVVNPGFQNPEIAKELGEQIMIKKMEEAGFAISDEKSEEVRKVIFSFFGMRDLAKQILKIQPFYYDSSKNWWMWNEEKCCWALVDETDLLNWISRLSTANTIKSSEKNEIIEAMKQEGRLRKPKDISPYWIQFKRTIVDVMTGKEFEASSEYFVTNPIPWELHPEKFIETPVMDRIFEEWVGKDHVRILYEILSYCLLPSYPIHRLFCLIGAGSNGKGCYLRLLKTFIGDSNVTSTELDTLITSRFEVARLHKKLVCIMGETNFKEIENTSMLKKLTGEDLIGFEYKNKTPFDDMNYAKIIMATNNLPSTTDKTTGFYRRWSIIDFPNNFSEEKNILEEIPEDEYKSLALKCVGILRDLLIARKFTNEGTIEERAKRYEDRSNPLEKFLNEFTEEDVDGNITKSDFQKKFSNWCLSNKVRQMSDIIIRKKMKDKGYDEGRVYINWWEGESQTKKLARAWLGIKWKDQ